MNKCTTENKQNKFRQKKKKKGRNSLYSKAKALYIEVMEDSLIKLAFHPHSSEPQKVWKGFDSAGNRKKKIPPSTDPNTSHGCPPVTSLHTAHTSKRHYKRRRDREGLPPPHHHSPPIKYTLANSTGVPSLSLNPPCSPTLMSSELICAKQPNIRKVCWKVSAHVSN